MNKQEKNAEAELIEGRLKKAQIALIADYRGLSVTQITTLRKKLTDLKAEGRVVKNTLARIATRNAFADDQGAELDKFLAQLKGPTLLISSNVDPVEPAKAIQEFAKGKEGFKVRGAWVDGTFVDASGVEALSKMPGKQELLSMLLRLINEPATRLARVINAPAQQTVQVVESVRKKLEG